MSIVHTAAELKHLLTAAGIDNQAALARKLDVSVQAMSYWLNGKRPIPTWLIVYLELLVEYNKLAGGTRAERLAAMIRLVKEDEN